MRSKLFWKLFLGNAVLMTAMLVSCVWLIAAQVDHFHEEDLTTSLRSQAESLRHLLADEFDVAHAARLRQVAHEIGRDNPAGMRITFIAADGTVLADSLADPAVMEPHDQRGEVHAALRSGWGEETRLSHTLDRPMKYVAVRVGSADVPVGVVRVAMPLRTIGQRAESFHRLLWGIAGIALAASLLFALGLARLWSGPIRRITITARDLSRGNLSARVRVIGNDELAALARSLNQMRDSLAVQMETIDRQRALMESLLAHLRDSTIVAGPDGRIVLMNLAAHRLLGLIGPDGQPLAVEGIPVERCVPYPQLQRILLGTAGDPDENVQQIRLHNSGSGDISLLASSSPIILPASGPGEQAEATGRLLVLTDVTPLTRMIQVKADFAANASHELRTPLSAIRMAVETLQQIDLAAQPDKCRQFLDVIERHSRRMEAMVADLLDLSRIESAPTQFKPTAINLREVIEEIYERMTARLQAKHLNWVAELPESPPPIMANPYLLRLVLENLVDNAVKFTEPGGHIRLTCRTDASGPDRAVVILVEDDGCGIPPEEQERVFERFHQVQRARSGPERGTGLGLSIVRHAVAAMGGTVELTSQVGRGTTVAIALPQKS